MADADRFLTVTYRESHRCPSIPSHRRREPEQQSTPPTTISAGTFTRSVGASKHWPNPGWVLTPI